MQLATDHNRIYKKDAYDKGKYGEYSVSLVLRRLDPHWYKVINNIIIRNEDTGKTAQIDHIVVSIYGIFIIETKNYSGLIIGDSSDSSWLQVTDNGKQEVYSPTHQNYGHLRALRSFIDEAIPIYSIVCFTNADDVDLLVNSGDNIVITSDKLQETIQSYTQMRLLLGQVDDLYDLIKSKALTGEGVVREHRQTIVEAKIRMKKRELSAVCPKCERPAVIRKGDTKPRFCAEFPHCNHVSYSNF